MPKETYPGPGEWPSDLVDATPEPAPETKAETVVWVPYVVVRPWDHGTLYTCSLCGNYPDFPSREEAQLHVDAHSTTTA